MVITIDDKDYASLLWERLGGRIYADCTDIILKYLNGIMCGSVVFKLEHLVSVKGLKSSIFTGRAVQFVDI